MDEPDEPPAAEGRVPTTAADFRELQREYSARRRFHEMQAETFARLEQEASRIAAGMEGVGPVRIMPYGESVLTSKDRLSTLDDVNATPSSNALRAKKQLDANPAHAFVALLKREGLTVNEVATALSVKLKRAVPRNTVQSWYKKTGDDGFRRIPTDAAEALHALYGLAVDSWPRRAPAKK